MGRLFPTFKRFVLEDGLIEGGERIVASVSGGVDSMVMLDLLVRIAGPMNLDIVVAHANHMLRGKESGGDQRLVKERADALGVDCVVKRLKPKAGKNVQDAARRLRFEFLHDLARRSGARSVCLGHNRGDQAETVVMHLMRGAGLSGLRGMVPISLKDGVSIIRPLIFASRREIESYAGERGIAFREDSTNARTRYRRNEVRHLIMPMLEDVNPKVEERLYVMSARLGEDEDALAEIARASFDESVLSQGRDSVVISRRHYGALPPAIRRRMLRLMYAKLAGTRADLLSDQIIRMDRIALSGRRSGEYRLKSPWRFELRGERIGIAKSGPRPGGQRSKSR